MRQIQNNRETPSVNDLMVNGMAKGIIRNAIVATGIDPTIVRLALGKFDQAKMSKKITKSFGGSKALANMGGQILNNPFLQSATGVIGTMLGGPLGGVMLNKGLASTSFVKNNNKLNELKQQERGLIQDAVGATVARAIGLPPEASGYMSQYLGGVMKRKEQKRNNGRLDKVVSSGLATGLNMVNGMVSGIVKNAIVAFGGSGEVYDQFTATPFTPEAKWTGAQKIDTSKEGLIDRAQEYAFEQLLIANGMDADLAKTVASTTNGKIKAKKAKKAKKEERISAIESTVQTGLAIAAIVVTAGAAAPAVAGTAGATTAATAAATAANTAVTMSSTIGSVMSGAASASTYISHP